MFYIFLAIHFLFSILFPLFLVLGHNKNVPKDYDPKFEPFYLRKITFLEYIELVFGTAFLLYPRII